VTGAATASLPPLVVWLRDAMFTFSPGRDITVGRGSDTDIRVDIAAKQAISRVHMVHQHHAVGRGRQKPKRHLRRRQAREHCADRRRHPHHPGFTGRAAADVPDHHTEAAGRADRCAAPGSGHGNVASAADTGCASPATRTAAAAAATATTPPAGATATAAACTRAWPIGTAVGPHSGAAAGAAHAATPGNHAGRAGRRNRRRHDWGGQKGSPARRGHHRAAFHIDCAH
jgi:hypothetical protein